MVNIVALVGLDILSRSNQTNSATIFVRSSPGTSAAKTTRSTRSPARVNGKLFGLQGRGRRSRSTSPRSRASAPPRASRSTCRTAAGQDIRDFAQHVQEFRQAANQLPAVAGRQRRRSAPTCRRSTSTSTGTRPRRAASSLTDLFATLQALLSHAVHQRLQPLRPDLPGAGGGAGAVPPDAEDIGRLYVRGSERRDDPALGARRRPSSGARPASITRFNGFPSALVHRRAQAGPQLGRAARRSRASWWHSSSRRRASASRTRGQSFQERASSGAGGAGVRARPGDRLPGARRAVRELVDSVRRAVRRPVRRVRRAARHLAPRTCRATSTSRSA